MRSEFCGYLWIFNEFLLDMHRPSSESCQKRLRGFASTEADVRQAGARVAVGSVLDLQMFRREVESESNVLQDVASVHNIHTPLIPREVWIKRMVFILDVFVWLQLTLKDFRSLASVPRPSWWG